MKKRNIIVLTILSFILLLIGFFHIPLLNLLGVDVFALRGILIFTILPTVGIFSIPFACCITLLINKVDKEKKK